MVDCGAPLGSTCTDPTGAPGASCGAGNIVSQDFEVKGDQPFAVSTFTMGASLVDRNDMSPSQAGDPDQSMAVTTEQFRSKYVFLAPIDYPNDYVVIVAPMGAMETLDGRKRQPISRRRAGGHVRLRSCEGLVRFFPGG